MGKCSKRMRVLHVILYVVLHLLVSPLSYDRTSGITVIEDIQSSVKSITIQRVPQSVLATPLSVRCCARSAYVTEAQANVKLTTYSAPPFGLMSKASVSGFDFTMVGATATPSEDNGETATVKV